MTTAKPDLSAMATETEGATKALDGLTKGGCVQNEAPPEEPAPPIEEPELAPVP